MEWRFIDELLCELHSYGADLDRDFRACGDDEAGSIAAELDMICDTFNHLHRLANPR